MAVFSGARSSRERGKRVPGGATAALVALVCVGLVWSSAAVANSAYPLREEYPQVQTIGTDELNSSYDHFLIIDVRSAAEFEVIHMVGAVHVPLSDSKAFQPSLEKLAGDRKTPIVMYCNGITCSKSYKAAAKARQGGFTNVRAYDAGIMRWGHAHPEKTTLLGETPLDRKRLFSREDLESRMLGLDDFMRGAAARNAIVFDIRDASQREEIPDLPGIESRNVELTRFSQTVSTEEFRQQAQGKTIYVFDAVGRQVRWVQYYLEANGVSNYYFLQEGVSSLEAPASAAD